jgi:hypothetical protein
VTPTIRGSGSESDITPIDGDSTLELALPRSTLREWLGDCASPAK